jgi:flagellar L-ring protein precursor FlgH
MKPTISAVILMTAAGSVLGQSSSLYTAPPPPPLPTDIRGRTLNAALEQGSYLAVGLPEPRKFAIHDLITIIIREQSSATSEATLDTDKKTSAKGGINAFPSLQLKDLIEGQLPGGDLTNPPEVDVQFQNKFEGEGEYERKDSLTTRLTARVIDVKPNGTLVLEARTMIQNDKEKLDIAVTGQCRAEDVTPDNAVLSTQLYDLRIDKKHSGELRSTTSKGILTRLLDLVFNF